ncbi:cation:proton antiporter regulatory subunit [Microbacterium xanthum]|uniref:cation:proton antiporter regulatory subunit n=1 Tax=Microbacterium xanthum TaxID=3079794 RepID=UPI002AD566A2|nr:MULTISPECIES: TrkA C-terminal domain-containing protein [unclassified Microbacterium]MDZ8172994.1 TrkA C-terminal domain-containing protein [Microbacterium sp. KSW-48]MDZ8200846.1 TrkA C-terminal domain-containing protein [Microbacterium sp. SSW1-59]
MPVNVERTELPGIGIRHDVETAAGRRLSVITFRDGGREIAVADPHDPDRAEVSLEITDDEATALSEVLGGSLIMTQLAGLREQVSGLSTSQIPVRADSPYAGRPLGETRARTLTRCSIVAVVRAGGVVPAPGPADVLSVGDALVAIGTPSGLEMLARIIEGS